RQAVPAGSGANSSACASPLAVGSCRAFSTGGSLKPAAYVCTESGSFARSVRPVLSTSAVSTAYPGETAVAVPPLFTCTTASELLDQTAVDADKSCFPPAVV